MKTPDIYAEFAARVAEPAGKPCTRNGGKARELGMGFGRPGIQPITTEQLDLVLLPATTAGELSARFNAGNFATEYRRGDQLLAVSVGGHHFVESQS